MESDKTFRDNLEQALEKEENRPEDETVVAADDETPPADGTGSLPAEDNRKLDVFLSYSSLNKNVADAVVAEFEQHGIRCWYAPRDIIPGQEWVSAIRDAITACRLFVLIYTDSSNESRQVANEVALAFNSGKTLIPFRLSDAAMSSELEYYLTRVHWLDAVNPPLMQSIVSLREYSERILRGEVPKESKIRNAAAGGSSRKNCFRFVYPVLAVLVVAAVVVGIVAVTSKNSGNKSNSEGECTATPTTEIIAAVSATPTVTHFPEEENADALYSKAYDLQASGQDRAAFDEAYECYMKTGDARTADENIIAAMFTLASYYYEAGSDEDADKGLALYRKAAECGSVRANNFLGSYYLEADADLRDEGGNREETEYNGRRISRELCDAILFYEKSAETGDAIALYSLGLIYENENDSYSIEPDCNAALTYYERAEQAGHSNASKACERVRKKLQE